MKLIASILRVCCVLLVSLVAACSDRRNEGQFIRYYGVCDGSAAVQVTGERLLVAYDEKNSLYLFAQRGGNVLADYPYASSLGISDDEVDVEGAVSVANGVWWIGSHGRDGDGNRAPNRQLLFRTSKPLSVDDELQVSQSVDNIFSIIKTAAIEQQLFTAKSLKKKAKRGGFNIEGLTTAPDGALLIGLRSPLTKDGHALVAKVSQVEHKFSVDEIFQLDLGNRGIRDIQKNQNGYAIIAGKVSSGGVFAIYQWQPGGSLKVLGHIDNGLNPEALVVFEDYLLVLSDDGKVVRSNGETCDELAASADKKDSREVYFRGYKFPLNTADTY